MRDSENPITLKSIDCLWRLDRVLVYLHGLVIVIELVVQRFFCGTVQVSESTRERPSVGLAKERHHFRDDSVLRRDD